MFHMSKTANMTSYVIQLIKFVKPYLLFRTKLKCIVTDVTSKRNGRDMYKLALVYMWNLLVLHAYFTINDPPSSK